MESNSLQNTAFGLANFAVKIKHIKFKSKKQKNSRFDILTSKTIFFFKSWSCVAGVSQFNFFQLIRTPICVNTLGTLPNASLAISDQSGPLSPPPTWTPKFQKMAQNGTFELTVISRSFLAERRLNLNKIEAEET